ncbi:LysE family transporter [Desulfovulcanus ferrireducens]|jgi:threonine/homoserine/homoserine lactone efflux protein|uniref:LysE family transporter n=1 Tax=Desulfovulcanus ferrireducens TaxID=2831190 RepID=UPI00207BC69B|nr:LysE family transporter [Desulfovulcanus ferrireducens]
MLTLLTIFFSSFVIALSGAMMPGPLLTASVSESSRRGFIAGPLLMIGHSLLELALVIALLLGLAPFLMLDEVFIVIAIAGAGFLFWMAIGMFRTLPTLSLSWDAGTEERGHLVITGALLSIANPYWLIWWATIGLGYLLHSRQFGMWGIFFFFTGHILADFAWYAAVSVAVGKGRHFLSDRLYRGIIGTCATFLVIFACYFVYAALHKVMLGNL